MWGTDEVWRRYGGTGVLRLLLRTCRVHCDTKCVYATVEEKGEGTEAADGRFGKGGKSLSQKFDCSARQANRYS